MTTLFVVIFVAAIATFLAAFAADYVSDWNSRYARKVGAAAWLTILFSFIGIVATGEDDDKGEGTKVTIECVVGDDSSLTCEVLDS